MRLVYPMDSRIVWYPTVYSCDKEMDGLTAQSILFERSDQENHQWLNRKELKEGK